jgi:hypothetical protein
MLNHPIFLSHTPSDGGVLFGRNLISDVPHTSEKWAHKISRNYGLRFVISVP